MVEEALVWFTDLPRLSQFLVLVGLATPLLVLRSYLAPPPKVKSPDFEVVMDDGKKGKAFKK